MTTKFTNERLAWIIYLVSQENQRLRRLYQMEREANANIESSNTILRRIIQTQRQLYEIEKESKTLRIKLEDEIS